METLKKKVNMPEIIFATKESLKYRDFLVAQFVKKPAPWKSHCKTSLIVLGDLSLFAGYPVRTMDLSYEKIQKLLTMSEAFKRINIAGEQVTTVGNVGNGFVSPPKWPPNIILLPSGEFLQLTTNGAIFTRGVVFSKETNPREVSTHGHAFLPLKNGAIVSISVPGVMKDELFIDAENCRVVSTEWFYQTKKPPEFVVHSTQMGTIMKGNYPAYYLFRELMRAPKIIPSSNFVRVKHPKTGLYVPAYLFGLPPLGDDDNYPCNFSFPPGNWELKKNKLVWGKSRVHVDYAKYLPGVKGRAIITSSDRHVLLRFDGNRIKIMRTALPMYAAPVIAALEKALVDLTEEGEELNMTIYREKVAA